VRKQTENNAKSQRVLLNLKTLEKNESRRTRKEMAGNNNKPPALSSATSNSQAAYLNRKPDNKIGPAFPPPGFSFRPLEHATFVMSAHAAHVVRVGLAVLSRGASVVLKRLRIAVLLYVLLFVATAQYFTARQTTDWDSPLWVDIYAVAGDGEPATRRYIDDLSSTEFTDAERFLAREAKRYGVALDQPFKLRMIGEHRDALPHLAPDASTLGVLSWSLRMRWLATRLHWQSAGPSGDIVVFAVFHEPTESAALDRSTALDKGLIAVANLFADRAAHGTNQIVLAQVVAHAALRISTH
jgi:hypothetical protein